MSKKELSDQETADVDFTNEQLALTHNHLAETIERLLENVSVENSNPCVFSFLMQMQVFVTTSYRELLQGEGGDEWRDVVEQFFTDNPQAFETKIWTERIDH
jgi:hypothetical protein